jgi:heme-degrading monooxygenase HmoA
VRAQIELFPEAPEASGGGVLFRALREDVAARFVSVADGRGPYEVVHEDGAVEGPGGVLLIEPFNVTPGAEDEFRAGWRRVWDVFAARQGYLGTRLYRAELRFVHIARWSSPLMVFRAVREAEFLRAAEAIGFPERPALYVAARGQPLHPEG